MICCVTNIWHIVCKTIWLIVPLRHGGWVNGVAKRLFVRRWRYFTPWAKTTVPPTNTKIQQKKHEYQNIQLHKCTNTEIQKYRYTEIQKYENTERGCPSDDEDISRLGLKPLRHPHTYNTHVATMWEFNIKYNPLYISWYKNPSKEYFFTLVQVF